MNNTSAVDVNIQAVSPESRPSANPGTAIPHKHKPTNNLIIEAPSKLSNQSRHSLEQMKPKCHIIVHLFHEIN
tara:strand:- start:212 stop:430 length:219 start_codon:yes stop_codon:yes gene_type:complete